MMDVRELKIGNYVYLQNSKTPYKITEIGYSEIEYPRYEASGISSEAVFRTYVENLNPIPLTEELLLKCGFEKHKWGIIGAIRDKYKYIYKYLMLKDTCYVNKTDSVQVPYPVEKQLTRWQKAKIELGGWAFGGILLALIIVGWLVYKMMKK